MIKINQRFGTIIRTRFFIKSRVYILIIVKACVDLTFSFVFIQLEQVDY